MQEVKEIVESIWNRRIDAVSDAYARCQEAGCSWGVNYWAGVYSSLVRVSSTKE